MRADDGEPVAEGGSSAQRGTNDVSVGTLTARQREIAGLLARGLSNGAIAERLVLTQGTVANHVASILQRLQFGSRTQVVAWAVEHGLHGGQDRLLTTLERLLEHQQTTLKSAMNHAANLVAEALGADKVDAFLEESETRTLVAVGTSATPLGHKQRRLGLDRLPTANGGRIAQVFETGQTHADADVQKDDQELIGIRRDLNVRSHIAVPLEIAGVRRGVLSAQSTQIDFFTERDLTFLQAVSHWVGNAAQRAELAERSVVASVQQGRRMAAEELVTVLAQDLQYYLAPVRGRVDRMQRRAARTQDTETHVEAVALRQSVDRLDSLISDLLDIARIDQGLFSVTRAPVDLAVLLTDVATATSGSDRRIVVMAPAELRVNADPIRLQQVVRTMLTLVTQQCPAGTTLFVHARIVLNEARYVAVVDVSDQGSANESLIGPRGLEPRNRTPISTGMGVGLFLAREIAEAHRGKLEIVSPSVTGPQLRLVLPADSSSAV